MNGQKTLLAGMIVASACSFGASCGSPSGDSGQTATQHTPPQLTPPPPPAQSSTYAVHEWGLIRIETGDVWNVGAVTHAPPPVPMVVRKPVLYFHTWADAPVHVDAATVVADHGTIREHWPLTQAASPHPESIAWTNLEIANRACTPAPLPSLSAPPCTTLGPGEECETPELATVRVPGSACVHTPNGDDTMLFYRSTNNAFTPSVTVTTTANGERRFQNTGPYDMPGSVFLFHPWPEGVLISEAPAPRAGQTSVLGSSMYDSDRASVRVRETLVSLGLTEGEANVFLCVWSDSFFRRDPQLVSNARETEVARGLRRSPARPPTDSVLYFLPEADIQRISRISFSPMPARVVRVMAIWAQL